MVTASRRRIWRNVGYLVFNFVATVAVTLINKACFTHVDFQFPAMLCNVHYVMTWLGVEGMRQLGMFERQPHESRRMDRDYMALIFVMGTSLPLSVVSLQLNSVGFNQISKLFVTPMVLCLEFWLDGATMSGPRIMALAVMCGFLVVCLGNDLEFNKKGFLIASLWVPLGGFYKVQWGRVMKQHQQQQAQSSSSSSSSSSSTSLSTMSMMHRTLPYALLLQLMVTPLVDPPGFLDFAWTLSNIGWIGGSGVAAFLVNLSGFLVMGSVGAMAHVVLGQLKTILICLCAHYLFDSHYTGLQIVSAMGALASILAYTHLSMMAHEDDDHDDHDKPDKDDDKISPNSPIHKEEMIDPLQEEDEGKAFLDREAPNETMDDNYGEATRKRKPMLA
eukprot:CAMPEP_0198305172 /NCGR_PEP_ID=MMETSP1449-20131203/57774_1 /TAXON_ID=420275 /ORGANISM="Attheya septentrionalis, Strain CCMP2084" /LENGTH=388 /DNA_ID=CAMNT_0044007703 /DNA_START=65 /DNA_END=1231 /DNA_ORIENTATION=+